MDAFQIAWHRFHPGLFPLGHLLRDATHWNATRFHLLPDDRAAAHSRDELRLLIERYNTMGTASLGEDEPCWLVVAQSPNQNKAHWTRMNRIKQRYAMQAGWEFYSTTDHLNYTVWSGDVRWRANSFNRLLLHIYHQDIWDVIWVRKSDGAVFHAYECGVDVSQPTPQALIDLVSRYYGWLAQSDRGYLKFNPKQMAGVKFQVSKPCAEAINRLTGRA
ncbi:hypothetical protein [Asticcacaulis sp. EMRT-3]|uniref:DUF3885 domain-containing protein n=1 Tax=Asticcacaulis sp. EMRT-3 TaxID=3040349 RepID=UPI0024AFC09F|nr:hypothetical protein [Asticcacaulis sp. EMRT-3]MDI7773843.1 hypothetical protein [Asticcacaulis sp. EMRT-3]